VMLKRSVSFKRKTKLLLLLWIKPKPAALSLKEN
jgi:fructose-1-phosphate kinase PfkB-like protein